jgi:hypothetical protein
MRDERLLCGGTILRSRGEKEREYVIGNGKVGRTRGRERSKGQRMAGWGWGRGRIDLIDMRALGLGICSMTLR